jgi:hypothetical protein
MRLKRLAVLNFRNLRNIDLPLQPGTVIVGENRSGKSNLLHAVRLVLDASLPNADRYLAPEDFSEGLSEGDRDPMTEGEVIEVIVEFTDFEDDALALTAISEALVEDDPATALADVPIRSPRSSGGSVVVGYVLPMATPGRQRTNTGTDQQRPQGVPAHGLPRCPQRRRA